MTNPFAVNSGAWRAPFPEVAWAQITSKFDKLARQEPDFQHMADVVDSVVACRAANQLAGLTSMHDLLVVARPVPAEGPIDVVIVKAPSTHRGCLGPGWVAIEHVSTTGHDDEIIRPSGQAVPLFWRFMREKFAVAPRDGR